MMMMTTLICLVEPYPQAEPEGEDLSTSETMHSNETLFVVKHQTKCWQQCERLPSL